MSIAIKVENLSKAYQLGQIGTGTISRDLERWYARMRGMEDPFLRIGESNDQYTKSESDVVWSLKDINFEIEQGDAIGIIGRNGAGKSTLLKILSKVTAPTTGKISGKGRIASLLEVGTGFHPELSGRENIFLNGAILGMRKKEIQRKLEEIVDFAGIERYLDTPVKRYSSGMYVRLAFAVAAHLESEILIVDEVLAVGDAEFQKKCLGKMGEVSKGEGRTVLFVSHNMGSVKQLCKTGIILQNGTSAFKGGVDDAIEIYGSSVLESQDLKLELIDLISSNNDYLKIDLFEINGAKNLAFTLDKDIIHFNLRGEVGREFTFGIEVRIFNIENILIFIYAPSHVDGKLTHVNKGHFDFEETIELPQNMTNGTFLMEINLSYPNVETYMSIKNIVFEKNNFSTKSGRSLSYKDSGFIILKKHAI